MKARPFLSVIPVALLALAAVALAAWLLFATAPTLAPRLPAAHEATTPETDRPVGPGFAPVNANGTLETFGALGVALPGSWPQLRGPRADGINREGVPLAASWLEGGPTRLWEIELGEGHAGAAIHGGRVYVLDYDRGRQRDTLRCLSLADGQELWRYSYAVPLKRNHGLSRTVPAVTDRHVVTLGPKGHVTCLDAVTGDRRWALDLVRQHGTKIPDWYAAQCPLIRGDHVIIAPAGRDVLVMGVDLETGATAWTTPNTRGWEMTHASVAPMTLRGREMLVYAGMAGVVGVSPRDGSVLWEDASLEAVMARVATPVAMGDDRVLLCSGYGVGCVIAALREEGDTLRSETIATLAERAFGAETHTPIYHDGYIYGVRPDGQLTCLDRDGEVVWTSGREHRFYKGYGDWLVADGKIFVVDPGTTSRPAGVLVVAELTHRGYRPLARARVLDGHDAWAPMALAGGRLLLRDITRMVCLDVGARGRP